MIRWYPDLYVDQTTEKKLNKIKRKIEHGKVVLDLYAVCMASNPNNVFDIINVNELLFRHYKRATVRIVGLAYGKENAVKLVEKIVVDIYHSTNDFSPSQFFETFTE